MPDRKNTKAWAILPDCPGSYILIFSCKNGKNIRIGRHGYLQTEPGHYAYCGSAFGPGGLRARVGRHTRLHKKKRWHIDYLRPHIRLRQIWYSANGENLEHDMASAFNKMAVIDNKSTYPMTKFGATDCACPAHLFHFISMPGIVSQCRVHQDGQPLHLIQWG